MNVRRNEEFVPCKKFKYDKENEFASNEGTDKILTSKMELEAGSYYLGPPIKKYMCSPVTVCLGRKKGTNDYYLMKTLVLDDSNKSDRGLYMRRAIFHNEFAILSLLKNQDGIIQLVDFFKDYTYKKIQGKVKKLKRVCMVMECLLPDKPHNLDLTLLIHFLKRSRLTETEALYILYNLLVVIEKMHKNNVVHNEIKLSNIILNKKTLQVKLMDFYYAKIITNTCDDNQYKTISSNSPTFNDIWASGVVFYALLCGRHSVSGASLLGSLLSLTCSTKDLYVKVFEKKNTMLKNISVSEESKKLLHTILGSLPKHTMKASEAVDMVSTLLAIRFSSQMPDSNLANTDDNLDQVVPNNTNNDEDEMKTKFKLTSKINVEKLCLKSEEEEEEKCESPNVDQWENKIQNSFNKYKAYPSGTLSNSKPKNLSNQEGIKYAMTRLGVTSVNTITALSFSYTKRKL